MYIYDSAIVKTDDVFYCRIIRVDHDLDEEQVIMERAFENFSDAAIWTDDELSRLTAGKGVWDK